MTLACPFTLGRYPHRGRSQHHSSLDRYDPNIQSHVARDFRGKGMYAVDRSDSSSGPWVPGIDQPVDSYNGSEVSRIDPRDDQ